MGGLGTEQLSIWGVFLHYIGERQVGKGCTYNDTFPLLQKSMRRRRKATRQNKYTRTVWIVMIDDDKNKTWKSPAILLALCFTFSCFWRKGNPHSIFNKHVWFFVDRYQLVTLCELSIHSSSLKTIGSRTVFCFVPLNFLGLYVLTNIILSRFSPWVFSLAFVFFLFLHFPSLIDSVNVVPVSPNTSSCPSRLVRLCNSSELQDSLFHAHHLLCFFCPESLGNFGLTISRTGSCSVLFRQLSYYMFLQNRTWNKKRGENWER